MLNVAHVETRKIKVKCSVCGKKIVITVYPDKTYTGGNCFRSPDPKDKTEDWECNECWEGK